MATRTLYVQSAPKTGYYTSLREALDDASPDTTIRISAGTYIESELPITKPGLKIVAEGDGTPIIQAVGIGLIVSAAASFNGITFISDDLASSPVLVTGGSPVFTKCTLQSMFVDIEGAPIVQSCTFVGSPTSGLTISGAGSGEFVNNVFRQHRLYCIAIDSHGSPLLQSNQFSQAGCGCVCVWGSRSTPIFKRNNFHDTLPPASVSLGDQQHAVTPATTDIRAGFIAANGAAPALDSNTFFDGGCHALAVFGVGWRPAGVTSATPSVVHGRRSNRVHIGRGNETRASGVLNVVRNTFRDHSKGFAVYASDLGVRVVMESNRLEDNCGGVWASNGANVSMRADTCRSTTQAALLAVDMRTTISADQCSFSDGNTGGHAKEAALLKLVSCNIERMQFGIRASNRGSSDIASCTIVDSEAGAFAETFGAVRAAESTFSSNAVGVVGLDGGILYLSKCVLRRNGTAIESKLGATGRVSECTVSESRVAQVAVSSRGRVRFTANEIRDSDCPAVFVHQYGAGEFVNNMFSGCRTTTIRLEQGADPLFTGNRITSGSCEGVLVDRSAAGTFIGNTIADFRSSSGVVVRNGAFPTFRGNVVTGNSLAGVELQQGSLGIFENNKITNNSKCGVQISGDGNLEAVVTRNDIEHCPIGVFAVDSCRATVSRNWVRHCRIGVAALRRSRPNCVANHISDNGVGILVADKDTQGVFVANTITGNFDCGVVVRGEASPLLLHNVISFHFESRESPWPTEKSAHSKVRPGQAVCGLLLVEGAAGRYVENVFVSNSVAVEAHRTCASLMGNVFRENYCGLWCKNANEAKEGMRGTRGLTEHMQYVTTAPGVARVDNPTNTVGMERSEDWKGSTADCGPSTLRVCQCAFIGNGVGASIADGGTVFIGMSHFARNELAGISVTGRTVMLSVMQSIFTEHRQHSLYTANPVSSATSVAFSGCLFSGMNGNVVVTKQRSAIRFVDCAFVGCTVLVSGDADPLFIGTVHTGLRDNFVAFSRCTGHQEVEYTIEGESSRPRLPSAAGHDLPTARVAVSVWSFPISACIRFFDRAKGKMQGCIISFATDGVHVEKASTSLEGCSVHRCGSSGVTIGPGFCGVLSSCSLFCNVGCGVRVVGKMVSPACIRGCSVFGQFVVPLSGSTQELHLPDVTGDAPFTGQERELQAKAEQPVPKYTCPNTDGPGVGIFVEASGCLILEDCEVFASGVANVIVTGKLSNTIRGSRLYSADGYGMVVRLGAVVLCSATYFLDNSYCGVVCESGSAATLDGCTSHGSAVGVLLIADTSVISRSCILKNRVCGVRFCDGSRGQVLDTELNDNGCGVECRAPLSTMPRIANCKIHSNHFIGVLASGSARPIIADCVIAGHSTGSGVVVRIDALMTLRGTHIRANQHGVVSRVGGAVNAENCVIAANHVGVLAEFGGVGYMTRCLLQSNAQHSVLSRTQGNIEFVDNLFLRDSTILVTMEGRCAFSANTFRSPISSCFVIQRGGNPTITNSKFSALHLSSVEHARAQLQHMQLLGPKRLSEDTPRTPSWVPDSTVTDGSEGITQHVECAAGSLRRKTLEIRPSSAELHRRRGESFAAIVTRRAPTDGGASAEEEIEGMAMLEASQLVEEEVRTAERSIPIIIESGGLGNISQCLFAHNSPCSLLVDGATTEPSVLDSTFFGHSVAGLVVSNHASPTLDGNNFAQNNLAVQLVWNSSRMTACTFWHNRTGVEVGDSCKGVITKCHFFENNLAINWLRGASVRAEDCVFHRCDSGCFLDIGSSGKIAGCRFYSSMRSAIASESDSAVQAADGCFIYGGAFGIIVSTCGMLRVSNTEIVGCSAAGIAFHSATGLSAREAAQGSATKCRISGCAAGVSISGPGTAPLIQDVCVQHCGVGFSVADGANPVIQTSRCSHNNIGLHVFGHALGTFKRIEFINNEIGVKLLSGVEDAPVLTHSNILDSGSAAMILDGDAGGEVTDCAIFDSSVGLQCAGRAFTRIDFTTVSHAMSAARAGERAVQRLSDQQRVVLGANVQIKFDNSPPYNQLNARLRGIEHVKERTQYEKRAADLSEDCARVEDESVVAFQKVVARFALDRGISSGADAEVASTEFSLDPFICATTLPSSVASKPRQLSLVAAPPVLRDNAVPRTAEDSSANAIAAEEEASLSTGESPSSAFCDTDVPFSGYDTTSYGPTQRSFKRRTPSRHGESVKMPQLRLVKRKPKLPHGPTKSPSLKKGRRSRMSVFSSTDSRAEIEEAGSYGSLTATQSLGLSGLTPSGGAGQRDALLQSLEERRAALTVEASIDDAPLSIPLLPPLPTIPVVSPAHRPYPRKRVEVRACAVTSSDELLPPLLPRQPSTLTLACINHPQHAKFRYSAQIHRAVVELGRDYSRPFAEQLLQWFHWADRRNREALSVADVARFVEHLCETYRFHPGKLEAIRRATLVQQRGTEGCSPQEVPSRSPRGSVVFLDQTGDTGELPLLRTVSGPVSPFTPIPQFASEWSHAAFRELLLKCPATEDASLQDFAAVVVHSDSVVAPLFQIHFTWMLMPQPKSEDCHDAHKIRSQKVKKQKPGRTHVATS